MELESIIREISLKKEPNGLVSEYAHLIRGPKNPGRTIHNIEKHIGSDIGDKDGDCDCADCDDCCGCDCDCCDC
jgi:hypothetical protein